MQEGEFIVFNDINNDTIDKFCGENEYIYRFLPLERFLETIQTKKLSFVSPKKWNDPFDNFLFRQEIKNNDNFLNKIFVLCFTQNPHSQAYWKTYANEGFCVRLKIRTKELIELLRNSKDKVWLGKMKYLNETKLVEELQQTKGLKKSLEYDKINELFIKTFLLKRRPFQYEKESRIIVQSNAVESGIKKFNIDIKKIIKDIYLDPRMGKHEELAWKDYLKQFDIPVRKSLLFKEKNIAIQ